MIKIFRKSRENWSVYNYDFPASRCLVERVDVFAETFLVLMKLIVRPCLAIHNRRTTFQMVYTAL